jgi:catechol 2,3-dioxygenase-like lactoylglutathione lyase family enzyme
MQPVPLTHIGILVKDLDASRPRWATVLDLPFSPITRYRPQNWSDLGNPVPHLHDARLTFFLGVNPSIEILEFVGNGTHSPAKGEGGHHVAFPPLADCALRRQELADLGIGTDGEFFHAGRWMLTFADARPMNNVYTEWVEEHPDHPDVKDDLSPINRLPDGSKTLFDIATIEAVGGVRPPSGITEIGIAVDDLDKAAITWQAVIGCHFHGDADQTSMVSNELHPRIRLVQQSDTASRQGLYFAVVSVPDLGRTQARLRSAGAPIFHKRLGPEGSQEEVWVDPEYLNDFSIRFRAA